MAPTMKLDETIYENIGPVSGQPAKPQKSVSVNQKIVSKSNRVGTPLQPKDVYAFTSSTKPVHKFASNHKQLRT